ncbi:unnamed protein product [Enterobius vermicularis]|uniref:Endoplasmic reticulum junction formation protein lunapark n=1 Tax=Enterobius vermicularis TaxID=51028 RepID=A0A0N4VNB6_ENTVE|nr:unnamed protein product [Enterobius vermicularis]
MGNILFRRKKYVADELEELQKRGEAIDAQIKSSIVKRQTVQWFSSLSVFFLMLISIGFSLITGTDKGLRVAYSGFFLLYCFRRMINEYYNWSIQRKIHAREEVTKKKRELLEKVKETETFKVAKEILDKYEDTPVPDPGQPRLSRRSPCRNQSINTSDTSFGASPTKNDDEKVKENEATSETVRPAESNPQVDSRPVRHMPPKPPRPFYKPSQSVTEKLVDFIIGDTPSDRFALICSHCHGHNGMARKEEFDFLSYKCWICGSFNPSRQQRIIHTKSEENLCSESRIKTNSEEEEKEPSKEIRNRAKTRSVSHQRPLTANLDADKKSDEETKDKKED